MNARALVANAEIAAVMRVLCTLAATFVIPAPGYLDS
jgi:hypothetical protein